MRVVAVLAASGRALVRRRNTVVRPSLVCEQCAVAMCVECVRGSQGAADTVVDSIGLTAADEPTALDATGVVDGLLGAEAWAAAPPPKRSKATPPAEVAALPAASVHNCRLRCPWCSFTTPSEPGLVSHITRTHVGEALDSQSVVFFDGLGRGLCAECGALRTRRCSQCSRCRTSSLPRRCGLDIAS